MNFEAETYRIKDEAEKPFIDPEEIEEMLKVSHPTDEQIRQIVAKSLNKQRLTLHELALLINANTPGQKSRIKQGAIQLKQQVYGKRIVLFAPLYVGSKCSNNCSYCGFKASNTKALRRTLNQRELIENVKALEENGHKRLILVYGEHPSYDAQFIADSVREVYRVKKGNGEIRRVNINAAPLDKDGFKTVREAGIGTYQIFQETYHPEAYKQYHLGGKKSDYNYRLTSLDRAMLAGIDDVGIGALFGLYDWRFELMGLLRHVNHLEACFNVGPHTISFPRITDTADFTANPRFAMSDDDFTLMVAITRLAVPYTGLILTAREPYHVRKEVLQYGCSQIDAGTKIEIGAYAEKKSSKNQDLDKEQFLINDNRSLNEVIHELIDQEYLPSFCTACYRKGRTGEHFMEFSVPGFIKRYCSPNALLTLAEYLEDYAPAKTAKKGWKLIEAECTRLEKEKSVLRLNKRLERIKKGERDIYY